MKKIAVFPGSFDPITLGHVDLVKRAIPLFDEIIVAIGNNSQKKTLFSLEDRRKWIALAFAEFSQVRVGVFEGLTVDFCRQSGARFILRGIRSTSDFDYEKTISQLNYIVGDQIETIFLISRPEYSHISSTIVREIINANGNARPFLPESVQY
ncbi:MAG TPA: pantetheine-phosphate adenylyltransferase [Cyclobacteriaceae bacterium]|nr:pantetheine-phosphate adenylyltransferase [Cyclobacteriaceae bacterium]